jgi:hypothetical protein
LLLYSNNSVPSTLAGGIKGFDPNTCSPMSRRYQEIEENAQHDVDVAKVAIKRLGDRERAFLIAWLCKYFSDEGSMLSPQISKHRRTVVIDGIEFWLVQIPKRKGSETRK